MDSRRTRRPYSRGYSFQESSSSRNSSPSKRLSSIDLCVQGVNILSLRENLKKAQNSSKTQLFDTSSQKSGYSSPISAFSCDVSTIPSSKFDSCIDNTELTTLNSSDLIGGSSLNTTIEDQIEVASYKPLLTPESINKTSIIQDDPSTAVNSPNENDSNTTPSSSCYLSWIESTDYKNQTRDSPVNKDKITLDWVEQCGDSDAPKHVKISREDCMKIIKYTRIINSIINGALTGNIKEEENKTTQGNTAQIKIEDELSKLKNDGKSNLTLNLKAVNEPEMAVNLAVNASKLIQTDISLPNTKTAPKIFESILRQLSFGGDDVNEELVIDNVSNFN